MEANAKNDFILTKVNISHYIFNIFCPLRKERDEQPCRRDVDRRLQYKNCLVPKPSFHKYNFKQTKLIPSETGVRV